MSRNRYKLNDKKRAYNLKITGLVQGVGFRPFVYRHAHELGVTGEVRNQTDGVRIHVEGSERALRSFIDGMRTRAPAAAVIDEIFVLEAVPTGADRFIIVRSTDTADVVTRVSPDLPVCADCLRDLREDSRGVPGEYPRRLDYAFTNCTNCGPRFSIVIALPYDRPQTTMGAFEMCDDCRREYEDVLDRRFHAQPVACRHCGPRYTLSADSLAAKLDTGRIVAMKGIGGFHLACDATNQVAVEELRARKRREAKPFAVMFADVDAVARYAFVSEAERVLLESNARPIVLLRTVGLEHEPAPVAAMPIAPAVSNGLHTIGAILPYMPMHHLLFDRLKTAGIVLTSGNRSSEPIVTSNADAAEILGPVADVLLTHDREIHNRQDDSVAMVVTGRARLLRRSRGYVPNPVRLPFSADGIVAVGAEQKSTLCFGSGNDAILSQHIGDLDDAATLEFFEEVLDRFPELFRVSPRLMVRDSHPDYLSTLLAEQSGLPTVAVGHHHAHIASCMAEHGLTGPVIGVALDGTGFGDDGAVWGGEFMIAELTGYERFAHFDYIRLPGGDLAVNEPWRSGLSYLTRAFGPEGLRSSARSSLAIFRDEVVTSRERDAALHALAGGINAPLTSSAGRLFDAVAALCGICTRSRFDAEAPMRLTDCLAEGVEETYPFEIAGPLGDAPRRVQFDPMIRQIVHDVAAGIPVGLISARFHNTICKSLVDVAREAREERGINRVALSGGVFQNWYLLARSEEKLAAAGFEVFSHEKVPSNDGGIALGQLTVAAARERG
ncbi:MAG: carbamoyltransferase HypF [Spirochaetia bacterium]